MRAGVRNCYEDLKELISRYGQSVLVETVQELIELEIIDRETRRQLVAVAKTGRDPDSRYSSYVVLEDDFVLVRADTLGEVIQFEGAARGSRGAECQIARIVHVAPRLLKDYSPYAR